MTLVRHRLLTPEGLPLPGQKVTALLMLREDLSDDSYALNVPVNASFTGGVIRRRVVSTSDSDGWLEWELPPNEYIVPAGTYYQLQGLGRNRTILSVFDSAIPVDLSECQLDLVDFNASNLVIVRGPRGKNALAGPDLVDAAATVAQQTAQQTAQAVLDTKVDVNTYTAGLKAKADNAALSSKVDGDTFTAALGGKQDKAAIAADLAPQVSNGSVLAVALRAAFRPGVVDLRDMLGGAQLPNDGTINASPILQAAFDALTTVYTATGRPQQLFVPAGKYRLNTELTARSGVGVRGAGMQQTIFRPQAQQSAIVYYPPDLTTLIYDLAFSDFTIDGAAQTDTAYNAGIKGFRIGNLVRGRFDRVEVLNTWASGFGADYLQDVVFSDCVARRAGRGYGPGTASANGSGAGFGIGVGAHASESVTLVNCTATECGTNGFFTERLVNHDTPYKPYGFKMIGCTSRFNKHGYLDAGAGGVLILGCEFTDNTFAGVSLRITIPEIPEAGERGLVSGCLIMRNGNPTANINDIGTGGGVVAVQASRGRYDFADCIIRENYGAGVWFTPSSVVGPSMKFRGCTVTDNWRSGFLIEGAEPLVRFRVSDCEIANNGKDATVSYRDGITILVATDRLHITGNVIYDDRAVKFQNRALDLKFSSKTSVQPRIMDNDCFGNVFDPAIRTDQSIADSTYVKDNVVSAPVLTPGYFIDNFDRADGALGVTSTGARPWVHTGTGSAAIIGNQLTTSQINGQRGAELVMTGLTDGAVRATLATVDASHAAALAFRGTDYNNHLLLGARASATVSNWALAQRIGGTVTTLQDLGVPSASGDQVLVVLSGTTVTISINGTQAYTGTVTAQAAATGVGVIGATASSSTTNDARWDNISFQAA